MCSRWMLFLTVILCLSFGTLGGEAWIECRYSWTHVGRTWSLAHRFSAASYQFFQGLPRVLGFARYDRYVTDRRDDPQVQSLLDALQQLAVAAGLDSWARLNLVIAFVQGIPYAAEEAEYPRYPLETLVDRQGDCEDMAILAAALLQRMHFDVVLLAFTEEQHMALGLCVTLPVTQHERTAFVWEGKDYYYVEVTGPGWAVGEVPPRYRSAPVIIPLRSGAR